MLYPLFYRIYIYITSINDNNVTTFNLASSTQYYNKHSNMVCNKTSYTFLIAEKSLMKLANYPFSPKTRHRRRPHARPLPPFSFLLQDAKANKKYTILSCICIPPALCHPVTQKVIKCASSTDRNRPKSRHKCNWLYSLLPFLLLLTATNAVFFPGTNHAIIKEKISS